MSSIGARLKPRSRAFPSATMRQACCSCWTRIQVRRLPAAESVRADRVSRGRWATTGAERSWAL